MKIKKFYTLIKNNITNSPSLKSDIRSAIVSAILTLIITILFLQLTAYPSTEAAIWQDLKKIAYKELSSYVDDCSQDNMIVNSSRLSNEDAGPLRTIIAIGTCSTNNERTYRWISIFSSREQSLIDRLAGRPSGYEVNWFGYIESLVPENVLIPSDITVEDLDKDGIQEFHIRLKSTWADAKSFGFLIFKKNDINSEWTVYGLPSISKLVDKFLTGEKLTPFPGVGLSSLSFFGLPDTSDAITPPEREILKAGIYEEQWELVSKKKRQSFSTLRNGGNYSISKHPRQEYPIIRTVGFFRDGASVMSPHYAAVFFFKLSQKGLLVDELWNWGYPMISIAPLRASDINIDDIQEAGVAAHEEGNIYFGHTEFERR